MIVNRGHVAWKWLMTNKLTGRKLDEFYAAIGRFVLTWAEVEFGLDLLVIIVRQHSASDTRLPHQLSAKIDFIRSQTKTIPCLNDYRLAINEIIDEIAILSDTRHDYVHGTALEHAIERSALVVSMGRLLQPPKKERRKSIRVTALLIKHTSDRLHAIGGQLLDLAEILNRIGRPN
jgi:hypothetical protein